VRGKEITIMTAEAGPKPSDAPVTDLVMLAHDGDQRAWDAIVERYALLVWSICRRYRLDGADAVWLQLVHQTGRIRDPAALPGWLATTTRRECGRIVRAARRTCPPGHGLDIGDIPDEQAAPADDQLLLAERRAALADLSLALPAADRPAHRGSPPCPTPRSAPGSASRSAASGPPAVAAWPSCAATRPSPP